MRIGPSYPQRVVKGECIGRFLGITVKWSSRVGALPRVGARRGTLKNLRNVYGVGCPIVGKTSSSVSLHICAVKYTCITEISLHLT